MPPDLQQQVEILTEKVKLLEDKINLLVVPDRYYFHRDIDMFNGKNIRFGLGTGTKIGTATTQKLGFYNVTPIVQPGAISSPAGGLTVDAEARTAISSILTALRNLGLIST